MNPRLNFRGPSSIEAATFDNNQLEIARGNAYRTGSGKVDALSISEPAVQRKLSASEHEGNVMRKENGATKGNVSSQLQAGILSKKGGGQGLESSVNGFMSNEFGSDFSNVKVHHDKQANEMADQVNARAFTVGNDIFFNKNEYQPNSKSGKKLLAHELTHVVQQSPNIERKRKDGPNITRSNGQQLSRWRKNGDEATVSKKGDTLAQLAHSITGNWRDWACIWIKSMRNSNKSWKKGFEKWLEIGDTFDISNLNATSGVSATITFTGADQYLTAVQTLYGGAGANADFMAQLESLALSGDTPIQNLTLVGHSAGSTMWGDNSNYDASSVTANSPRQDGVAANNNSGPPRCWFTRNATIRFVGCSSTGVASTTASNFLRKGATAIGTNHWICGWNFTSPAVFSGISVEQPCNFPPTTTTYLTPAAFHGAAGVWETHNGKQ